MKDIYIQYRNNITQHKFMERIDQQKGDKGDIKSDRNRS